MHSGEGSVHRAPWPSADMYAKACHGAAPRILRYAGEALAALRRLKSEAKVSMKTPILSATLHASGEAATAVRATLPDISEAVRVTGPITVIESTTTPVDAPQADGSDSDVTVTVGDFELGEPPAKRR